MSEADTQPNRSTVNIRIAETFLEDIDTTWEDEGYNSRSEFIRSVLRDAVKHPAFNRADLKAIVASEVDIQEGRVHPSEAIKADYDLNTPTHDTDDEDTAEPEQ